MPTTATDIARVLPSFPSKDLGSFQVESLLGGGGFSHVVLARDAAGVECALKLIPAPGAACLDDVDASPLLLSEARIHVLLTRAGEPSVLPCADAFKAVYINEAGRAGSGSAARSTYMAVLRMPVAACSVEEWLFSATPPPAACQGAAAGQVDEQEVLGVWMQMVNAVHRCHVHGVVHKDVKLPNFLMDSRGKAMIMDFGLAQLEGVTPRAVAGTPWTMSPAAFKHGDDGRAGDWWSLGVVLYQLLQGGAWPFKHCWWPWQRRGGAAMEAAIRRAVLAGHITFASSGPGGASRRVSEPVKALIRGLLQPDPNRRWQLRQVLASPAIGPELLQDLSQRFPELKENMEELLELQRRARGMQALGSDGGSSGGGAAVAAAGVERVARGVAAAVAAAAEGWPHWHGAGKLLAGDGAGGSAYEPLLGHESGAADGKPAAASGRTRHAPAEGGDGGRGGDLTLLLPDDPSITAAGGAPGAAERRSLVRASGAHDNLMRHSLTTPSLLGAGSAASAEGHAAADASLLSSPGGFGALPPGLHHSLSGAELGSPHGRPHSRSLAHPRSDLLASPGSGRLRGSRTSLHDLFGVQTGLPGSGQQPHPGSVVAGGGAGGVVRSFGRRESWLLQLQSAGERGSNGGAGGSGEEEGYAFRAAQSSWVPPPPEAVAAGAAIIGNRPLSGTRSKLSGGGASASAVAPSVASSASLAVPVLPVSRQLGLVGVHGGHGVHAGGLLARLRRLFTVCMQRPGVKYAVYDGDEYDTLSGN